MAIMDSRRLSIALLITALVLSCETSEIEEQLDTCVWVEVNLHQSHNSSERPCTAPHKPLNGDYESEANGAMYETGDTITYHCNRGYQLIGQANRICNGTSKGWEPQEAYCQPEYIGHLMIRLEGIEKKITTLENITSGTRNIISVIDNKVSAMENIFATTESRLSVGANVSLLESRDSETDMTRQRIIACTNKTDVVDEDTVSKCLTMQLGERNGHSVSVFKWTVEDFESKRPTEGEVIYYSDPFYHTVPGYKFRLRTTIFSDYGAWTNLNFVPSESDDQLRWPFSTRHDMTVLLKNGTEFLYKHFSGQHPTCTFNRHTYEEHFRCYTLNSDWTNVFKYSEYVLKDGSMVVNLYMYN